LYASTGPPATQRARLRVESPRRSRDKFIPGEFRIGMHMAAWIAREDLDLGKDGLQVMHASMTGWVLHDGEKVVATPESADTRGPFTKGMFATLEEKGGSAMLISGHVAKTSPLEYRYRKGGYISLHYTPKTGVMARDEAFRVMLGFAGAASGTTTAQMLAFARKFGISRPGSAGYQPKVTRGENVGNYLYWELNGKGVGVEAQVPKADMPGFLPTIVDGLNGNWSAFLLDHKRKWPNFRALPIRDGASFAQLDLNEGDSDLFIGHPVTCGEKEVKIQVAWQEPGVWFVEAHNPTDEAVKTELRSSPGWTPFAFRETVELAPGTSRIWLVKEKPAK
jgi:hypothetical protein